MNQMAALSKAFDIPIDPFLGRSNGKVEFDLPSLKKNPATIQEFFFGIQKYMEFMVTQDSSHIHYVTNEVPLFQYFFSPEVTAFKLFIWARSIWDWEAVQDQQFSCQKFIHEFNLPNESNKILDLYMNIDSTEFWNTDILNNTINQIKYYEAAGVFQSRSDIDKIYDGLSFVLKHAEQMARRGKKFYPKKGSILESKKDFNLYRNQFMYSNNIILTTTTIKKSVFTTYDSPNFMKSDHEQFCTYTLDWFKRLKKRSNKISQESEKERKTFFDILNRKISCEQTELN